MNKAVQLPSGKIIDLSRFIALIPSDDTVENHLYFLILDGYAEPIELNSQEASSIKKHLQEDATPEPSSGGSPEGADSRGARTGRIAPAVVRVETEKKHNGTWDREEQLRLNQPKIKKLKEKIERIKQEEPSAEKAEFFENFKKTMDAHRTGRKLYEH